MNENNKNYYAVLLAGGIGSRFWPVSTPEYPKQFHDILGVGRSMLQSTFDRISKIIPKENIFIISNKRYIDIIKEQLPELSENQIVGEPEMKNTAPCILMSSYKIQQLNPDALIAVLPCDHWIRDEDAFVEDIQHCFSFCEQKHEALLTIGIKPYFPSTGYGYIKYKNKKSNQSISKALDFMEKPDEQTAQYFIGSQEYLWNSGMFVWHTEGIIKTFEKYNPTMCQLFNSHDYNTDREISFLDKAFAATENISIDYAIMEQADNIHVLPANFYWNDIGTWGALHTEITDSKSENAIIGSKEKHLKNSTGNIIYTSKKKKIIIDGLSDYIIVDNDDALVIYPRSKEQKIKKIAKKFDK